MENSKKKVAIICEAAGIIHRGGESFAIELGNYLSEIYDVDMYTTAKKIDGFQGNIITVAYAPNNLLKKYMGLFEKSSLLQKLIWCSRYTNILHPTAIESFQFAKVVFREIKKRDNYYVIFPVTGPGCHWAAKKYRDRHFVPFFATGGGGMGPGEWWIIKSKPNCYVCISNEQYKWASKYTSKTELIPNGTYISDYSKPTRKEKYTINKKNKLVICAGHLDTSFKRHQLAIQAVSKIKNVDLLILGQGEAKEELMSLGNRLMPGRLQIFGVPHSEIAYYYQSADLFTLPSLAEPFGIVYIEAMAAGLPCVATDDETRREIIGNAGITCDVENIEEYSKAIKDALSIDWDDKPYKRASCYDYSVIGAKYVEMIKRICDLHR